MSLGLKITDLRKREGWSQEDLAERLEVSRQSVSKWESEQAMPDIEKIIKLSALFGVSTDYLLKDAVAERVVVEAEDKSVAKILTAAEGEEFIDAVNSGRKKIALGVMLCIISPIPLITLGALSDLGIIAETFSGVLGIALLLVAVAVALMLFIPTGMKLDLYEYIKKTEFRLEEGFEAKVQGLHDEYEPTFRRNITVGVLLCVVSVVPLILTAFIGGGVVGVNLLLAIVSVAVYLFVGAGMLHDCYCQLLQTGDYSPEKKAPSLTSRILGGIYWPLVVILYLAVSFYTSRWDITWIIWPVAAILSGVVENILKIKNKDE